jgi:hypothetical protein
MGRTAKAIAEFFRLAFWPLAGAVLVVLPLQPVYVLSLASLNSIAPPDRIFGHLAAAFEQGVLADDGAPKPLLWKGGEQLAECIALGIGTNKAESAWSNALAAPYPMVGETHACNGLHKAIAGEPFSWRPYFRYWHGYRMILAPLTAAFPLWLVKIVNALMVAAAFAALWRILRTLSDTTVATLFVITFVCLSDVLFIWRTSPHSISLAFILAGAALFGALLHKDWRPGGLLILAAALGSVFNFIDFLINPPMMPMLLAFFVLLSGRRDAGLLAFAVVVGWFGGYAETWLAKWAIAYVTMPPSAGVLADILSNAENRSFGSFSGVDLVPLAATVRAFLRSLSRVGVIVPAIVLIAIAHYSATVSRIDWRRAAWLCSPVLVSVLWFEALTSHTQFHLTVSSRSAAAGLAIILAALLLSMQRRPSLADLWAHLGLVRAKLPLFRKTRS